MQKHLNNCNVNTWQGFTTNGYAMKTILFNIKMF